MSLLRSVALWLSSPGPTGAIEIAADRVTAVLVGGRRRFEVIGHAVEPLPPGAVEPAVSGTNIIDRATVTAGVRAVIGRLPGRPLRVGVVVPDAAAKVSLVRFDREPKREADLDPMIRWHVRKAVPFRLEDAQVGYSPGLRLDNGGREYLVVVMKRDIVREYEAVCGEAGVRPGIVDLATCSLINASLAGRPAVTDEDWLLVHLAAGYQSVAIVRGKDVVLFRNHSGDDHVSDLVHQTAMYYEDRLKGAGIARVLIARSSGDEEVELATRALAARLGAPVEAVRPSVAIRDTDTGLGALAAPVGLLAREYAAA